jgi:hypothetical protein
MPSTTDALDPAGDADDNAMKLSSNTVPGYHQSERPQWVESRH